MHLLTISVPSQFNLTTKCPGSLFLMPSFPITIRALSRHEEKETYRYTRNRYRDVRADAEGERKKGKKNGTCREPAWHGDPRVYTFLFPRTLRQDFAIVRYLASLYGLSRISKDTILLPRMKIFCPAKELLYVRRGCVNNR